MNSRFNIIISLLFCKSSALIPHRQIYFPFSAKNPQELNIKFISALLWLCFYQLLALFCISAESLQSKSSLTKSSIGKNWEKYHISPIEIRKHLNDSNINLMFVHYLIVFIFNEQLSKSEQNYFLSASLYKSNQKAIIYGTHQQCDSALFHIPL